MKRTIKQIAAVATDEGESPLVVALAADGTLWCLGLYPGAEWEWLPNLPDIEPQPESDLDIVRDGDTLALRRLDSGL